MPADHPWERHLMRLGSVQRWSRRAERDHAQVPSVSSSGTGAIPAGPCGCRSDRPAGGEYALPRGAAPPPEPARPPGLSLERTLTLEAALGWLWFHSGDAEPQCPDALEVSTAST